MNIKNICGYDVDFDKLPNNFKILSSERGYELDDSSRVLDVSLHIELKNGINEIIKLESLEDALLLARDIYIFNTSNCKLTIYENSFHYELDCKFSRVFNLNPERILNMDFETKESRLLKCILSHYPSSVVQDIKKEITNGNLLSLK